MTTDRWESPKDVLRRLTEEMPTDVKPWARDGSDPREREARSGTAAPWSEQALAQAIATVDELRAALDQAQRENDAVWRLHDLHCGSAICDAITRRAALKGPADAS